jgi:hypothetical protein
VLLLVRLERGFRFAVEADERETESRVGESEELVVELVVVEEAVETEEEEDVFDVFEALDCERRAFLFVAWRNDERISMIPSSPSSSRSSGYWYRSCKCWRFQAL